MKNTAMRRRPAPTTLGLFGALLVTGTLYAQQDAPFDGDSAAELAKKTQNPIASMVSVPLQYNVDYGLGPADAMRQTLNVQPVIPFLLNDEWNLITRTIIPLIDAEAPLPLGENKSGVGDVLQSFFFSPKQACRGWIVGAGPALLYPTATDDAIGTEKWGAGPTFVALKQANGWTYGVLANHLWSYAGNTDREDVNATFLQPFLSKTLKTYTTFGVNTESTYAWEDDQWTVPLNATVSQLLKIIGQPISVQLGYRYYAEAPPGGPAWGLRGAVTLLFPN
jgi:hypothetical protein